MRLAVANLTRGGLSGGYRKYLQRMLPALSASPPVDAMLVLVPRGCMEGSIFSGSNVRVVEISDAVSTRKELQAFAPHAVLSPTARSLADGKWPEVIMVRNMEPLEKPFGRNSPMECLRNIGRAWVARCACRSATRIIAVSQHVRDFLISRWRIPASRIGLVYHGIDLPTEGNNGERPDSLSGLSRRFVFTAGSIRPARGLEDILGAMPEISRRAPGTGLVIAGQADPGSRGWERHLRRLAARLGITSFVYWAGCLNDAQMAWCFRHCNAFVCTSRAEACPNTVLEAMSFGCQSVSTTQAPMPEFFGNSAIYYRPRDAQGLAEAVLQAVTAPVEDRLARQALARARARDFDWAKTVEQTIAQLQQAIAEFAARRQRNHPLSGG